MMTEEAALRIVKQAEEQYDPGEICGLTTLVGCVTNRLFGEDRNEDGTLAWLDLHGGDFDTVVNSSSEEVAERLSKRVNDVSELLRLIDDRGL